MQRVERKHKLEFKFPQFKTSIFSNCSVFIIIQINSLNFIDFTVIEILILFCFLVYRLEEKEQEMKREYAKLHERYTELFKTHMDYMERTKILMGTADRMDGPGRPRIGPLSLAHINRFVNIYLLKLIFVFLIYSMTNLTANL